MERVSISEHLTYKKLLKINLSPIFMMLFVSLYSIIDGLFIANFSTNPSSFSGANLIWPVIMIVGGIGFVFGYGGSALVSKRLGENKQELANKTFTNIMLSAVVAGILLTIFGYIFIPDIAKLLASITKGSTPDMVSEATKYGRILMLGQVFFITQNMFQNFLMVDGKPNLGFFFTLGSGITNIVLDALFVAVLKLGCIGAAIGTIVGYVVGSVGPLIYFLRKKDGNIFFSKPSLDFKSVLFSCYNGMSDFVTNIANSIVGVVINLYLLDFYGENGVSAYGIIMYVILIFISVFLGTTIGTAPCISYQYGAKNPNEIKNILKKCLVIMVISGVLMCFLGIILSKPISIIYANGNEELISLSTKALAIFSISFTIMGINIFIASFFTALGNGAVSAIISILRCLVLQIGTIVLLPIIFKTHDSIWYYAIACELLSLIISVIFLIANKKKYNY